uniref:ATP-dependent DNA helicase n=1 Tax=Trichuris muris TaxID=70415 RepID=A0A5S6QVX7_TRIMR
MHQQDIRSEQYQTLHDFVLSNNTASGPPGKRIILPSSYPGSPRAVMQDFQDAMAIVSAHGKPDYFVTFTCNPKWREIEENLLPGQSASDRPDLVARIYKLKVDALLHALLHEHVWGRVRAYVSVYEWQKRGLPHTHTLLIMDEDAKPRNPNDVDSIVRAELPDRQAEPLLYDIVSKNMIHRPCGDLNPLAPCMLNGACLKRFPKRFRDFTNVEIDGYPEYRRRDDGNTVEYQGVRLDNRWIVPYNPRLTMMLRAHVNVEICAMIEAVKYLFKYVYKGPDRGAVRLIRREHLSEDGHITDEISAHLDVRYVCAPEAVHHIFGFRTGRKSDVICRLAVHLFGQQNITFQAGHEPQAALRALTRNSTLTAWFKKNEESAAIANSGSLADDFLDSRLYRYVEMPCYYTFNRATTLWNRRQRGSRQIGRMYTVSPQDPERYALRLLLLNVKGAVSFEHLRTVESGDGSVVVCQTFAEAARTNGLLADDSHYLLTLQEAAAFQMPRQLRAVFVSIIAFNEVNDCNVLWERTKRDLSEDFRNQGRNEDEAEAMAYYEIEERLGRLGKDLKQFLRVPAPPPPPPSAAEATDFRPRECRLKGQQLYATLNTEQKAACDTIIRSIDTASSERLFFIDGPGGSGKTYLYQTMFNLLVGRNLRVLCTAWTGIAANLLPAGRTSASAFKLNVKNNCEDSHIKRLTRASRELEALHVIIWDEASMIPKAALQTVNSLLRDVTQSSALFGGKTVILGGDFRQVLPIVRRGSREAQVDACIKRSDLWNYFTSLHLFSNMRIATGDADWIEFLLRAGDGTANDEDGRISLPEGIVSHDNLVVKIFGNSIDPLDQSDMSERAILAPKNVDADFLNHEVLNRLQGEEKAYHSVDEAICDDPSHVATYPTEFLHRINLSRLPPHVLRLKKGCVVILLRNLDITEGLCNGTRLVVERFGPRLLACRFACGERKAYVLSSRELTTTRTTTCHFDCRQFPVRLAFALSINKAQGQSFSRIGLWLPSEVFTHGQLYVALSRVKSREGFLLQADCDNRPLNVVYREVL